MGPFFDQKVLDVSIVITDNSLVALLQGQDEKRLVDQERFQATGALFQAYLDQNGFALEPGVGSRGKPENRLLRSTKSLLDQSGEISIEVQGFIERLRATP